MYIHCVQCIYTVCNVYTLCAMYILCVQCIYTVCNVYTLCAMYIHCVQCIHTVCNVYTLCAMYIHCVQCIYKGPPRRANKFTMSRPYWLSLQDIYSLIAWRVIAQMKACDSITRKMKQINVLAHSERKLFQQITFLCRCKHQFSRFTQHKVRSYSVTSPCIWNSELLVVYASYIKCNWLPCQMGKIRTNLYVCCV
jgi:hypothetical protein